MITKNTIIDKIEIVGPFKHVQIREAVVIDEDGTELSRSFVRHVISPLDDSSNEPQEVKDIIAIVHTQSIKDDYTASLL
jgi:hypothetical protein